MENIQEIDTKRVNGWLDLDSYFVNRLGRNFTDREDLFNERLIDIENGGRSNKFWILSEDKEKIALFKEQLSVDSDESYAELISEEISKILGMPTAHYDLATFNGEKGVISYNFIKKEDSYYSGFDIITDFYEQKLENNSELSELYGIDYYRNDIDDVLDKLNNLEDVWIILEEKYKGFHDKERIVSRIVNGLVDKLIFDILTVNVDDHCDNWGELDSLEDGRILAPQFDNARIINLHKNIFIEKTNSKETLQDKELVFTVDNSKIRKPLEVLDHFLKVSSSEYTDLVIRKVNTLKDNIDNVPSRIENRTEFPMPRYLKEYFTTTMHDHLDKVEEVIYKKGKGSK